MARRGGAGPPPSGSLPAAGAVRAARASAVQRRVSAGRLRGRRGPPGGTGRSLPVRCSVGREPPPSGPSVGQGPLPVRSAVGQGPASGAPVGQGPSFSTSAGQGPRPVPGSPGQGPSLQHPAGAGPLLVRCPVGQDPFSNTPVGPGPSLCALPWGAGAQLPSAPLCGAGPSPGAPGGQGNPLLSTHHGRQAALPLGPTVRCGAGTSTGKRDTACPCCLPMPDPLGGPLLRVTLGLPVALWRCHRVLACESEGTAWRRGQRRLDGGLGPHRPGVAEEGAGAAQRDGGHASTPYPSCPDPLYKGELPGGPTLGSEFPGHPVPGSHRRGMRHVPLLFWASDRTPRVPSAPKYHPEMGKAASWSDTELLFLPCRHVQNLPSIRRFGRGRTLVPRD